MPIVTIEQTAGRTLEQRRQLARGITEAFVAAYGLRPDQVTIVFHEHRAADFAKEGLLYSDRQAGRVKS